ncbi:MAG: glycosyltransferase family 4 protein [Thalassobaculales bacterium]
MPPPRLGIGWQVAGGYGWGEYGYAILRHLAESGRAQPVLFEQPLLHDLDPIDQARLAPILAAIGEHGAKDFAVLTALGNGGVPAYRTRNSPLSGRPDIGIAFIEDTRDAAGALARYDQIVAGSTWNRDIMAGWGLKDVPVVVQGVDPDIFHPAPRRNRFAGRFVVFSGGKIEYRKGQDIVAKAFSVFRQRHPEALLIAVWGNPHLAGPSFRRLTLSPYIDELPVRDGKLAFGRMFGQLGLSGRDVHVFTRWPHFRLAGLMRDCDVALFPNRCEGGTNLVAMEAIACGVPTILSANTGHLDILGDGVIALGRQRPVSVPELGTQGWGESDIEEIVAALEQVWRDREGARRRALAAAQAMLALSWDSQVSRLLDIALAA